MTWRERIIAARARGGFLSEDCELAATWTTCAVGEQHATVWPVLLRFQEPAHGALDDLGMQFMASVDGNDMMRAETILNDIEDSVMGLKRRNERPQR